MCQIVSFITSNLVYKHEWYYSPHHTPKMSNFQNIKNTSWHKQNTENGLKTLSFKLYTTVVRATVKRDIIIFSLSLGEWARGRGGGVENMDKQSDQRQPGRKKGVQSEGREGEERGEKRQGREGCGLGKLWSIVSPLLRHTTLPFMQREREVRETEDRGSSKMVVRKFTELWTFRCKLKHSNKFQLTEWKTHSLFVQCLQGNSKYNFPTPEQVTWRDRYTNSMFPACIIRMSKWNGLKTIKRIN